MIRKVVPGVGEDEEEQALGLRAQADNAAEDANDKTKSHLDVVLIVTLWVISSNLFNASSKLVSTNNPWTAFATTTTQLGGTTLLGLSLMWARGSNFRSFFGTPLRKAMPIGLGLALANGSMMWALSRTSIGMFQTVKASSPLFTAFACHVVLGRRYTSRTYISLIPIMFGLGAASATDLEADLLGIAACVFSSVCQVFVNLSAKHLLEQTFDDLDNAPGKARFLLPFELQSLVSIVGFFTCAMALMAAVAYSMIIQGPADTNNIEDVPWSESISHLFPPLSLLFWNVLLYSTENVLAYASNGKMPRLPFAVVDAVRRLSIVISFNFIFTQKTPSLANLSGVIAVAAGSICFAYVVEER